MCTINCCIIAYLYRTDLEIRRKNKMMEKSSWILHRLKVINYICLFVPETDSCKQLSLSLITRNHMCAIRIRMFKGRWCLWLVTFYMVIFVVRALDNRTRRDVANWLCKKKKGLIFVEWAFWLFIYLFLLFRWSIN